MRTKPSDVYFSLESWGLYKQCVPVLLPLAQIGMTGIVRASQLDITRTSDMTGGLVWSFNWRKCKLTRTLFPDRTKIKAWSVVSGQNVNLNTSPQELDINLSALGSIYLTAAVSIERYFTVCHPYYTVKLKHSSCENVS